MLPIPRQQQQHLSANPSIYAGRIFSARKSPIRRVLRRRRLIDIYGWVTAGPPVACCKRGVDSFSWFLKHWTLKSSVDRLNAGALFMLEIIMIMILIRTDETQISFRPGQVSLFEKNTKNFLFSPLPPTPRPLYTHAAHQSGQFCTVFTVFICIRATCYLTALAAWDTVPWIWGQKSSVTEANPVSSLSLQNWLQFNFISAQTEKTCHVPCCRRYVFVLMSGQYHRQYRDWSTARNFLALRGQRDFITL